MTFSPPRSGPPFIRGSRFTRNKPPVSADEHRLNERIRVPRVRLIDDVGNQVGIVETREALRMARDKGLDLMEVAPNANPPVCKILDYGKFKYEKKKKEQQAKKKQAVVKVKEIQLRPNTEEHDLEYKFNNVRNFLEAGDKAKITMLFRGREVTKVDHGQKIMSKLIETVKDVSILESPPMMEGRKLIMILAPVVGKKPRKDSSEEDSEDDHHATEQPPSKGS